MTVLVEDRPGLARERARLTGRVALVPTMGALHDGHLALVDAARAAGADRVVVSIFVNPLQFAPGEDFDRYPRSLEADTAALRDRGVDLVFAPTPEVMYPHPTQVTVSPGPLGEILEGASRPGFFTGVLTVVTKLFQLVRPDLAVFGEKDYQQLTLVRRLVADLDLPVEIVGVPTVREPDGLARSSRNAYLSESERRLAVVLSRALRAAAETPAAPLTAAREVLATEPDVALDYLELTAPDLTPPTGPGDARLLVAARVGTTRLIDNVAVRLTAVPANT